MNNFILNTQLVLETVPIIDWNLCSLLLRNDRNFPWIILVPRRTNVSEIYHLCKEDQAVLMDEIAQASTALQKYFKADKINIGALGNIVSQLHVHIIARYKTDLVWPRPVWGAVEINPYDEVLLRELQENLKKILCNIRV